MRPTSRSIERTERPWRDDGAGVHSSSMLLRLAAPTDGDALARIYRPAVTELATSFEVDPPDGAEMGRRVAALGQRLPWLVAEQEGRVLGYAYASPHRDRRAYQWSVEVSAYVDGEVQRSGIGRRLYAALFAVLALQEYRNAYAGITLPNEASERFHERMGFRRVGVFHGIGYKIGRWHDVGWYERALIPRAPEPPPPRPLAEVIGTEVVARVLAQSVTGVVDH